MGCRDLPSGFVRDGQHIGRQHVTAACHQRKVLGQAVRIEVRGQVGHQLLPAPFVPQGDRARRLLFQAAIGVALHVFDDAAEAVGQAGTEQQRDAAQPSNGIGRPFHRHAQLLFNLGERGLEHPHGHRRHYALFDPDAVADAALLPGFDLVGQSFDSERRHEIPAHLFRLARCEGQRQRF